MESSDTRRLPVPLCIFAWLTVQSCAILLAALRIPLWIHAPAAGEFLAIPILITIQTFSASLLFPRLTADWRSTVMAIAAAWPFAALAGLLAAAPVSTIILAGGYVSGWLVVLWIWRVSLSSSRSQMIGAAIAATWTAAGPVLLFIRNEYSVTPPPDLGRATYALLGPLINALSVVDSAGKSPDPWPWIVLLAAAALGGGTMWGKRIAIALFRENPRTSH